MVGVLPHPAFRAGGDPSRHSQPKHQKKNILQSIDYVQPNAQVSTDRTHLFIFEDNEAVIKMISKGRCPHMRHVLADASCELGLVGSFEKTKLDANASVTCVHTNQQIADITKSSFARNEWNELMIRFGIVPESFHHSPCSVVAALVPLAYEVAKRGHPFTDEASKYTGASSKSNPAGKRVLALAAVRHDESSPSIMLKKTRNPTSKAR